MTERKSWCACLTAGLCKQLSVTSLGIGGCGATRDYYPREIASKLPVYPRCRAMPCRGYSRLGKYQNEGGGTTVVRGSVGVSGGTEETPITTLRSGISCPRKGMAEGGSSSLATPDCAHFHSDSATPLSDGPSVLVDWVYSWCSAFVDR